MEKQQQGMYGELCENLSSPIRNAQQVTNDIDEMLNEKKRILKMNTRNDQKLT